MSRQRATEHGLGLRCRLFGEGSLPDLPLSAPGGRGSPRDVPWARVAVACSSCCCVLCVGWLSSLHARLFLLKTPFFSKEKKETPCQNGTLCGHDARVKVLCSRVAALWFPWRVSKYQWPALVSPGIPMTGFGVQPGRASVEFSPGSSTQQPCGARDLGPCGLLLSLKTPSRVLCACRQHFPLKS